MAGVVIAAGSLGLAALVGPAGVATAQPDVSVNGEPVAPPTPGLVIPWSGGDWAGHDWTTGWPGGAFNDPDDNKGGGGYANGVAGGAWNHTN
ncbi:hypothetical protein A5746_18470 [Mycolicibacterium conceptionense]|nr:hypothetical protein A5639_00765 [Mycolicibacterium conceptionense]OMB72985.1 hypothetical protein A5741_05595 [Mycolicibacterium conceptionense]OMB94062.1 hypothetical protein A5746_18470 [Mycolicibacterium conceptionense]